MTHGRVAGLAVALLTVASLPVAAQVPAPRADVCLEVAADALDDAEWAALVEGMEAVVADRPALFPDAVLSEVAVPGAQTRRLLIDAGHHQGAPDRSEPVSCLGPEETWGAELGRVFLEVGADQMLAEAPTTPGIASSVDIEWFAADGRLITRLEFAGPLDIPNGTCWLDETLAVDPEAGRAVVRTERGVETSPFAEGACGRFFDHLPDGGAAGQAAGLLPVEVTMPDGSAVRMVTSRASLTEDAVLLGGWFEPG